MAILSSMSIFLAATLLLHAAFSTMHCNFLSLSIFSFYSLFCLDKDLVEAAGITTSEHLIPTDVKVECVLAIVFALLGAVSGTSFSEPDEKEKTSWDFNVESARDFKAYNHRGRYIRNRLT